MIFVVILLALSAGCGDDGAGGGPPDATDTFPSDVRPGKRSDIVGAVSAAGDKLVVFGGDNGPIIDQTPRAAYLDDTWVLEPAKGWHQVTGAGPSARGRHAFALDASGNRALLFGGRFRTAGTTGNYALFNDLWAFDFASESWTMLDDGSGTAPSPRYFTTAVADSTGKLFVFGGDTNPSALNINPSNEVWSYTIASGWTEETTTGTPPSRRLFMAYTYDSKRNQLVVFGGQPGDFVSPALSDLFALDLGTLAWTQLAAANSGPAGSFSSAGLYDVERDRYVFIGGHADQGVTNDVWLYDPTANSWSQLGTGDSFTGGALGCLGNSREIPAGYVTEDLSAPERRSTPAFVALDGAYWLFGGESDCSDHLDDTWRMDPTTGAWTELIEARSGESCARRGDSCMCLCL